MRKTVLVCVGACAIDTILTVPHFPEEDSKLRATAFTMRRGGNSPNSLEVLQQILECDGDQDLDLFLVATLPAKSSNDAAIVHASFDLARKETTPDNDDVRSMPSNGAKRSRVNLSHCVYREDQAEAISSYIISSQDTSSRTIINHNAIPEMTFAEFVDSFQAIVSSSPDQNGWSADRFWFHFEGRIPPTVQKCIQYIRNHQAFDNEVRNSAELTISVELEKPGRQGLQELTCQADVIFYSKAWARGQECESAEECLRQQAERLIESPSTMSSRKKLLICPWGDEGAYALPVQGNLSSLTNFEKALLFTKDIVHSAAYDCSGKDIVDSTGAGDTFIAGMLYGFLARGDPGSPGQPRWSLKRTLDFANGLAGRKILQQGFDGLGESTRSLRNSLDQSTDV